MHALACFRGLLHTYAEIFFFDIFPLSLKRNCPHDLRGTKYLGTHKNAEKDFKCSNNVARPVSCIDMSITSQEHHDGNSSYLAQHSL